MVDNYSPQGWNDGQAGGTPLSAARLAHIEAGIDAVDAAEQTLPDHAYVDAGDTAARARANHTGTQPATTITGLASVATSGAYADLAGTPTIPAAYTDEQAMDAVAAAIVAGAGMSKVYDDPGNTITLSVTASGTTTTGDFGAVLLDSFAGADDDAKLTAALSAVSADTYKRTILLTNRLYTFTTANRAAFSGMRIQGPAGYSNSDKGAGFEASEVKLSLTGPWFTNNSTNVYDVSLRGLSFKGTSTATVLGQTGTDPTTASWWRLHMRDISASGVKTVLGTQSQALLVTGAHLDGFWEVNNTYNGSFHIGGSDNRLWTNGGFFDSDPAFNTAGSATGQAIIWLDFCENTSIGPIYVTCESLWTGVKITGPAYGSTGSNQGGPLNFWGCQIEGRNAGQGSNGAVVRMDGGIARFRDCGFHFGMVSPTTPGRVPTDAGMIHHSAGQLIVDGASYDRATGVAETVPLVYTAATGKCLVSGVQPQFRGGTWTGVPRVGLKTGNTENRITDATVTLVTI